MLKILFVNADFDGCGNYRCILPANMITKAGLAEADFSIIVTDKHIKYYDIFIFQRSSSAGVKKVIEVMKKNNRPVIYEIDDDLFRIPWCNPARRYYDVGRKRTASEIIKLCDGAIVTTEFLAGVLKKDYRVPSIEVIPNFLDKDVWGNIEKKHNEKLQLGWAGTVTHYEDLQICFDVMKQLAIQYDLGLTFIGYHPEHIDDIKDRLTFIPFSLFEKYPANLANIDIGVAPVVDNIFNRSKSWIKVLEYNSLGIPCVASKVENYIKACETGDGVMIAKNVKQWLTQLRKLIVDEDLRNGLGMKGKEWVSHRWLQDNAYRWVDYCEHIMKNHKSAVDQFGVSEKPENITTREDFEVAREKLENRNKYVTNERDMDMLINQGQVP